MSGLNFNLNKDDEILSINSPKKSIKGPYTVIYKDLPDRWAIVTLEWNGEPSIGMRWFWDSVGNPISRGYPTWFIVPSGLCKSILDGLPLRFDERKKVDAFLTGEIIGDELIELTTKK